MKAMRQEEDSIDLVGLGKAVGPVGITAILAFLMPSPSKEFLTVVFGITVLYPTLGRDLLARTKLPAYSPGDAKPLVEDLSEPETVAAGGLPKARN